MASQEYKWHIGTIQNRYHFLNLDFQQAEKIYSYELMKDSFNGSLSPWEAWDYETTVFTDILSEQQLIEYKRYNGNIVAQYKEDLVDADQWKLAEIEGLEERKQFYVNTFLPPLFKDFESIFSGRLIDNQSKIAFLKDEYAKFLAKSRGEAIAEHFRFNRTFMPNGLKTIILDHRLRCIMPAYLSFKRQMDPPTKKTGNFLMQQLDTLSDETENLLTSKLNELHEFSLAQVTKRYNESNLGSIWIAERTPAKEKENLVMSLLLFDEKKYDFYASS
jgi:hypothetical protein